MKQCIRHFVRPKKGRDDSVVARKLMLLVALAAMWLAPQCVYAQGAQYSTIALNVLGHPLAGVSIAVCNSTATIGSAATPCSPLVTIYTDETLSTVAPNPFTADSLGNYTFYAPPGKYQVQIYGTTITTTMKPVILSCAPNSSCAGGGPTNPANAVKPQPSDGVQYASPNGNDSNDGLSIGTAKLTLLAAYNALPSSGGTIYVSGTQGAPVSCTPASGQGLGIAGSGDPNYSSIPEVLNNVQWVKAKTGAVNIQGISAAAFAAASTNGWVTLLACGNDSTPGLWLSGVSGVTLSRLKIAAQSAVRLSIDSNGGRANSSNPSGTIEFDHLDLRSQCVISCSGGGGPTLDVGGNLIWFNIHDSVLENGTGNVATSNQAANAYFSNGGNNTSLGLLYFDHVFLTGGGGIRFDANTGVSASIYVRRSLMEGSGASQPLFEVINNGVFAANIILEGGVSDSGTNVPVVRVAAGNDPCSTNVSGVVQVAYYAFLEGPLTVGAGACSASASGGTATYAELTPVSNVIPAAKSQRGGLYGLQQPQVDQYRRSFGPSFVRFANLAAQNPASWVANTGTGDSLTQIQGPGDASGATNAAALSCTGNGGTGGCDYYVYNNSLTFSPGDYIYIGAWAQPASTAGFGSAPIGVFGRPISLEFVNNQPAVKMLASGPTAGAVNGPGFITDPSYQTDGNWQWLWALAKVTGANGSASQVKIHLAYQTGFPINAYAPMFVRIPAASVALVAAPAFSSALETGNTVTFTTTAAHSLYGAMPVVISGCSVSGYNGEWVVTGTPSSTTFTLYNPASGLGAPSGCVITPGNDSEITDWANNLASYGDNCASGTLCGIRGSTVPRIVASGTSTLGNSAITSGSCATVVTTAASGVLTTDRIEWSYASAPATADGLLTLSSYVTSGNVNWKLCNPTASSQTPSGLIVNWGVLR